MSEQSGNVDHAEIAKFEALASRWWDPESEFWPLHRMNPVRLDYLDDRVGLAGKRVLDVGCGGGLLAEAMARRGATVTAIDKGEAPLTVARLHRDETGIEVDYRQASAEELAADEAGRYDLVTCMELLEHVPEPDSTIRACARLLRPGGWAAFSTINRTPQAWLFAIVGAEYVANMLPRGTHQYARFIKPSEMTRWARVAGLEARDVSGMRYNPLSRSFRIAPPTDINYVALFQRGE
ncbi:MAG: bifunctional 2-polyprenyl-6-hydroxyphenol methylase/3-demethylubiquinol 3-O-methyltransferase UbiG [Gammaproteobacteria bacterium]|nr:bifunctional 2-polyprenyl-6-hydroxyphenol methylase/3-demethylubiquinol 3-O-methyltransferase UbiG [Gammaproteobacteria bacterium]